MAFDLLEWLAENESSPKKEVRNFLRSCYEDISGNKVKIVQQEGKEEGRDDVDEDDDSSLRNLLLDTTYEHFSLTEECDILLISEEDDRVTLLLTDTDARNLLPKLKAKLENRMDKLSKLLK